MKIRDLTAPLFEEVSPADIDNMVQYAGQRVFSSEEEARKFVASKENAGSPWNFGNPTGYWIEMSKVIPVYQTAKGWKLGSTKDLKRIKQRQYRRANPPFSWKNITLLEPNFTELRSFGFLDLSDRITGPKMVPMASLHPTESGQDEEQISEIIQWIKKDGEFKPLVIEEGGSIADGHHRFEALKLMKVKRVPVYTIVRGS